ncbi:MAG TPA: hypothetical protein VKB09_06050, partial [Thermomicrobiales bacterium]|nr:hypothetical protein [Thermomicrobiales bacterium]
MGLVPGSPIRWLAEGLIRLGTSVPFAEAGRLLAHSTGTTVAEATARRPTEAGAAWAQPELAATARPAETGGDGDAALAASGVQQVRADGVFARLVGGEWREVKLLTVGDVEVTGERVHAADLSSFARMTDHAAFGQQALGELHRRGTPEAA